MHTVTTALQGSRGGVAPSIDGPGVTVDGKEGQGVMVFCRWGWVFVFWLLRYSHRAGGREPGEGILCPGSNVFGG